MIAVLNCDHYKIMNGDIESAVNQSDPFDVIWSLEACFDVDRSDIGSVSNIGHRTVVAAAMFATVFGASGYRGVVDELRPNLRLILEALEILGVAPIAQEIKRIMVLAQARALTETSDEDEWSRFVADNADFRNQTQRDVPQSAARIAERLKHYIKANPTMFQ